MMILRDLATRMKRNKKILIQIAVNSDLQTVWAYWTDPRKIVDWYTGHKDMYTEKSINELIVGRKFCHSMKSNDGNISFLFKGIYTRIDPCNTLSYRMDDKRLVHTSFIEKNSKIIITKEIEMEEQNPLESQAIWWRNVLSNFKRHVETQSINK